MSSSPSPQSPSQSLDQSTNETIQVLELKHFLHEHLLTYDLVRNDGSGQTCALWRKNRHGGDDDDDDDDDDAYVYSCERCSVYLHKVCAELPRYIHSSLHPMHLLEVIPPFSVNNYCNLCDGQIYQGGYKCSSCDFKLHMEPCASEATFDPKNHYHSFRSWKPSLFTCDACGIDEQGTKCLSYVCSVCQLQIHTACFIAFPFTVRQRMHRHKLKLCYSSEIDFDYAKKLCKICHRNMNDVLCLYQCMDGCTSYIAHAKCATFSDLLMEDFVPEETGHDIISMDVERKELDAKQELEGITNFSHPHSLVLSNVEPAYDVAVCDGCVMPISAPFYACDSEQCKFFLHERCSVLSGTIQSPLHQHQLKLCDFANMAAKDIFFHGFTCEACQLQCNGFGYQCEDCDLTYDVECALFGETLNHPSHKCTLVLVSTSPSEENKCIACDSCFSTAYWCEECNFFLDLKCASLPTTIGHDCPTGKVWSIKPIKLWYDCIEHAGGQYYCDLCGETRGKDLWFYHCEDCHDSIHPKCILGRDDRFMYGKFYNIDGHCHTVCVTKKPKTDPLCDSCRRYCHDPTLVFCPTCNIYIHADRNCCGINPTWYGPIKNYSCRNTPSNPHVNENVDVNKKDDEDDQETTIGQVNHFCHPHSLVIGEYDREILCKEVCDGCGMPISAPFYTCPVKKGKCNFFLHKECFELPKQIQHPLHPHHPLVLNSFLDMPWDGVQVGFICYGCDALCNGLVYACGECKFFLEVGCSLLSDTLVHETHQCTLTLVDKINIRQEKGERKCTACNSVSCSCRYRCDECHFELDLHCVSLPKMAMYKCRQHEWDTRSRHLSYGDTKEEDDDENYCYECFDLVGENEWYYHCENCDQSAHPRCTSTRSSLLKNGVAYRVYNHFHNLVTVTAIHRNHNFCKVCDERLEDYNNLHCEECNIYFHVKCCRELRRV